MIETTFFQDVLNLYQRIEFNRSEEELSKIDKNILFYLADKKEQFILVNNPNIIEIDIKSAFPTIVTSLFHSNNNFIIELNKKKTKKEKNIFIAITLKDTEYLRRLNIICKMIIYGFVKENTNDFLLLELKKDGIIIQLDNKSYDQLILAVNKEEYFKNSLTEYIFNHNFNFHLTSYKSYLRCNKTTFVVHDDKLEIKGQYKYLPDKLFLFLNDYINGLNVDLFEIKRIYSKLFFNIIKINFLKDYLNDYYICNNRKIINSENKYVNYSNLISVDPLVYLRNFVYPLIASRRF